MEEVMELQAVHSEQHTHVNTHERDTRHANTHVHTAET